MQYNLLKQSNEYTLENAQKGKLPQISVKGKASYQSDVTTVPGSEIVGIQPVSKDQYKLYGEIVQPLTDLTVINQNKRIIVTQGEVDQLSVEVSLYQIKERVSDLYFGILLTQAQRAQSRLAIEDIEAGIERIASAVKYGTALKSTLNVLKAERLNIELRLLEQEALIKSYREMLDNFIGKRLTENTRLVKPQSMVIGHDINRPELRLFDSKINALALQSDLISKNNLPKFSLFFQGGIGRPALNFLSDDPEPYYIGGLRLSWNLANYYTSGNQKQIYSISQGMVESEKETFLFNTRLSMMHQTNEITKMQQMIAKDQEIVALREEVVITSKGQLENGVITANDYKTVVTDADLARQNLSLHTIELLRLQNQYKLTVGNEL
ncbi:MAG: TolC family protein [Cytophagales bacterium]|nr:TolC family protein [Cytophagales bacterium]